MGNNNTSEYAKTIISVYKFISFYEFHNQLKQLKITKSFNDIALFLTKHPICTNIHKTFLGYDVYENYNIYSPTFNYLEYLYETLSSDKINKVKIGLNKSDYDFLFNIK